MQGQDDAICTRPGANRARYACDAAVLSKTGACGGFGVVVLLFVEIFFFYF